MYRKTALVEAYMFGDPDMPQTFLDAICYKNDYFPGTPAHVHTSEGPRLIGISDWLVKDARGDFWSVKDDTFTQTYEAASDAGKLSR